MNVDKKKLLTLKKLEILLIKLKKSQNFSEKTKILKTAEKLLITLKE